MSRVMFDTLSYFNKLTDVGVPEKQARIHTDAMLDIMTEKLATKEDVQWLEKISEDTKTSLNGRMDQLERRMDQLETSLNGRMDQLETSLNGRIDDLEKRLNERLEAMSMRMTIKLGAIMVAGITLVEIFSKLLK